MIAEEPEVQGLDFGPVSIDSNRLGPELTALVAVMVMLLVFRWIYKRI
jgi:hypothetical protein